MPIDRDPPDRYETLRKHAEELIRHRSESTREAPSDILDLIHELKIHQAELEIQNDELKRAQNELINLYQEYESLYEFAPCGYLTLDEMGIITRVNLTGARLLGTVKKLLPYSSFRQFISSGWGDVYLSARKKCAETGIKQSVELPIDRKNDSSLWVRADIESDCDEAGAVIQWRMALVDITEQKEAEKRLRDQSKRAQQYFDTAEVIMVVIAMDASVTGINRKGLRVLGYQQEDVLDRNWFDTFVPYQFRKEARATFLTMPSDDIENAQFFDSPIVNKAGEERLIVWRNRALKDGNGNVNGVLCSGEDVTERRQAEHSLKLSHSLLAIANRDEPMSDLLIAFVAVVKAYTGCDGVGIRLLDTEGNIPYVAYKGFSREFHDSENPLSVRADRCMCVNVIKGDIIYGTECFTKGGAFCVNSTSRFLAAQPAEYMVSTCNNCNKAGYESVALIPIRLQSETLGLIHVADSKEDKVTAAMIEVLEHGAIQVATAIARIRAEEALRRNEKRMFRVVDNMPVLMAAYDKNVNILAWNRECERVSGYNAAEIVENPLALEMLYPDAVYRNRVIAEVIDMGLDFRDEEYALSCKDGTKSTISWSNMSGKWPIPGWHTWVIGVDITERKSFEKDLIESEKRFRNLVEGSIQGLIIHRDLKPLFVNQACADIYGYSVGEIMRMASFLDRVHEDDREKLAVYLNDCLHEKDTPNQFGFRGLRKEGAVIWLDHRVRVVEWFGAPAIQSTVFDITEKKEAEQALVSAYEGLEHAVEQRTQELTRVNTALKKSDRQRKALSRELIGLLEKDRQLIAMELHDHIGQGLTSLKLGLELARDQLSVEGDDLGKFLAIGTDRILQLLQDVKRISHGLRPSTLDKLGLIPSLKNLFSEFKDQSNIPIEFFVNSIPEGLLPEKELAIYRIIQEAINNVQKHAKTENIHINLITRKNIISLSVEDNGKGFDHKKAMISTGQKIPLGLLTMKERCEQFGGHFSIDTKIGFGTVVMAEVPR